MDHLDLQSYCSCHEICYDLQCICNVTKQDFMFVMKADIINDQLDEFGRLPVLFYSFFISIY